MSCITFICFVICFLVFLWIIDEYINKYRYLFSFLPSDVDVLPCKLLKISESSIKKGLIKLASHRGSSFMGPENTMVGFTNCLNSPISCKLLEFDVRLTKDKKLVILHDNSLQRTINGLGNINKLNWDQVKELDAAYYYTMDGKTYPLRGKNVHIPLVVDLLDMIKSRNDGDILLLFDIKDGDAIPEILKLIKIYNLEDSCILGSVDDNVNARIRKIKSKHIPATSGAINFFLIPILHWLGLLWIYPIRNEIYLGFGILTTKNLVKKLHYRNIRVAVFQPHLSLDTEKWHKYCKYANIDFILSDYPEVLCKVLKND